jgi:hypothetical protein
VQRIGESTGHVQRRRARIIFGIVSAQQSSATVGQLAELLQPHPVLVHHDVTQQPGFALDLPNVAFVPEPKRTGWATWGFCEAIFHTLKHALEHHDFDYFQLLSPTCLPIRPLESFERFVAEGAADANIDLLEVERDDDTLMTFGFRTYAPGGTVRFRVLRRVRRWYFGEDAALVQTSSLSLLRRAERRRSGWEALSGRVGLALTRRAALGQLGEHPFSSGLMAMIGGTFFGARRAVCDDLVRMGGDAHAMDYFRRLALVDETLFSTLLGNGGYTIGPSNHAVNPFMADGHPRWIEPSDLEALIGTGRFFGRKFVDDPQAPIRREVIGRIGARVPTP